MKHISGFYSQTATFSIYVSDLHFTLSLVILKTHIQVLRRRKLNPKNSVF